jgi:acyl-CoA reductase-like NAD-dependent aldehyde dehydrogenase
MTATAAMVAEHDLRLLVGDRRVDSSDGATREIIDPSTATVITSVPEATAADVDQAVAAAGAAQPAWNALGVRGRGDHVRALADLVVEHREELAAIEALDSGNSVDFMGIDVDISVQSMRDWPALALGLTGRTVDASPGNLHYTRRSPYGVVGRITAFNHPVLFAMTRMLPALVTGNTVVLKPAVQTPLATLAFAGLAARTLPPGVVNVVTGGAATGDALVTHPDVPRLGFTGSVPTGLLIQQRAASVGVKHVTLELGGKNAMVVLPDADLDRAVAGAHKGMNLEMCQGQSCGSTSRIFVHRSQHDAFVERLAAAFDAVAVAPASEPGRHMGPLVSEEHHSRVLEFIDSGQAEGATLVTGGRRPADLDRGYFVRPSVFAGVDMSMRIANEEIFGPVVSVLPWDRYDDMLASANCVELGLTASVWTDDLNLAHATADRLEAGYVWINDTSVHYWGMPFGGWKNSGIGVEESFDELESHQRVKSVHTILRDPHECSALREVDATS